MTTGKRFCRRCLLRDLSEADQAELKKYLLRIKPEDRASGAEYERRLSICRKCEYLLEATCLKCGCYAEFRSYGRHARCPDRRW